MADKRQATVFAALTDVVTHLPFPIRGIDADNGSEFINQQLFAYCRNNNLTTPPPSNARSRPSAATY